MEEPKEGLTMHQKFENLGETPLYILSHPVKNEISIYMNTVTQVEGEPWRIILEAAYERKKLPGAYLAEKEIEQQRDKKPGILLLERLISMKISVGELYEICCTKIPNRRDIIDLLEDNYANILNKWEIEKQSSFFNSIKPAESKLTISGLLCTCCNQPLKCQRAKSPNSLMLSCINSCPQPPVMLVDPSKFSPGTPNGGMRVHQDPLVEFNNNNTDENIAQDTSRTVSGESMFVNISDCGSVSSVSSNEQNYECNSRDHVASFDMVLGRQWLPNINSDFLPYDGSVQYHRQGSYPGSIQGFLPGVKQKRCSEGNIPTLSSHTEITQNGFPANISRIAFIPVMKPRTSVCECIDAFKHLHKVCNQYYYLWPNPNKKSFSEMISDVDCASAIVLCIPENIDVYSVYYNPQPMDEAELMSRKRHIHYLIQYIYRNSSKFVQNVILLTLPKADVPALPHPFRDCQSFSIEKSGLQKLVNYVKCLFDKVAIEKRQMGAKNLSN